MIGIKNGHFISFKTVMKVAFSLTKISLKNHYLEKQMRDQKLC